MLWARAVRAVTSVAALQRQTAQLHLRMTLDPTPAAEAATTLGTHVTLRPLVCCGPSGVGKGTLIGRLLEECSDWVGFSVSHTTRKPRPGEQHGVHYYFCSTDEMQRDIDKGIFIEHAHVHKNMYGTSLHEVERIQREGRLCVLDIDTQGVRLIRDKVGPGLAPRYVFIAPPSMEVLEARLRGRGTESEDAVRLRISNAQEEVRFGLESGAFDEIIINDSVERAYAQLRDVAHKWYMCSAASGAAQQNGGGVAQDDGEEEEEEAPAAAAAGGGGL